MVTVVNSNVLGLPILVADLVEEIVLMKEQMLAVGRQAHEVSNGTLHESGNVKVAVGGHCES